MLFDSPDPSQVYTTDTESSKDLKKVYSITEISSLLKGVVENHFTGIQIKGELSAVKRHSSGHLYFALKDDKAVIDGVCWRGSASKLAIDPQEGLEVVCTGRLTTYPGRSKYQMVVESMELAGEGALLKRLQDLKKQLLAEGLFDPQNKQEIPFLPRAIGVITSPTGAVIRDILHRLDDRFPVNVILWPVPVQGDGAAEKITNAIHGFQNSHIEQKPDVLIVARGGGSLEDLWCFNDERVVRAVAQCTIPVISAVGHETDTTLIDFASDHRAPTPTAAAERAVPVRSDLVLQAKTLERRQNQAMRRFFEDATQRTDDKGNSMERCMDGILNVLDQKMLRFILRSPEDLLDRLREKQHALTRRFDQSLKVFMDTRETNLAAKARLLESFSYERTLDRGFAVLKSTASGALIKSAQSLKAKDPVTLMMKDGNVKVEVL